MDAKDKTLMGSWRIPAVASMANAVASVTPQMLALVLLPSEPFGLFALGYLFYALASSLVLSFLCDSWLVRRAEGDEAGWETFSTVAVVMCLVFGVMTGLSLALVSTSPVAAIAAVSVGLSTYRTCLRYYYVGTGQWRNVLHSDVLTLLGLSVGCLCILVAGGSAGLWMVLTAWLAGAIGGVLTGPWPRLATRRAAAWVRASQTTIRPLVVDSVSADAASIGVPFLMLPLLGLNGFAMYRAVSNFSAPIRLVAAPFRPAIVANPAVALLLRHRAAVVLLAVIAGSLVWAAFRWAAGLAGDSVLIDLVPYAAALGLYVAGAVLLSYFPFVCRAKPGPPLHVGRAVQTVLGIALPIGGVAVADVSGAVWGFASAAVVSGLVWYRMAILSVRPGLQ